MIKANKKLNKNLIAIIINNSYLKMLIQLN